MVYFNTEDGNPEEYGGLDEAAKQMGSASEGQELVFTLEELFHKQLIAVLEAKYGERAKDFNIGFTWGKGGNLGHVELDVTDEEGKEVDLSGIVHAAAFSGQPDTPEDKRHKKPDREETDKGPDRPIKLAAEGSGAGVPPEDAASTGGSDDENNKRRKPQKTSDTTSDNAGADKNNDVCADQPADLQASIVTENASETAVEPSVDEIFGAMDPEAEDLEAESAMSSAGAEGPAGPDEPKKTSEDAKSATEQQKATASRRSPEGPNRPENFERSHSPEGTEGAEGGGVEAGVNSESTNRGTGVPPETVSTPAAAPVHGERAEALNMDYLIGLFDAPLESAHPIVIRYRAARDVYVKALKEKYSLSRFLKTGGGFFRKGLGKQELIDAQQNFQEVVKETLQLLHASGNLTNSQLVELTLELNETQLRKAHVDGPTSWIDKQVRKFTSWRKNNALKSSAGIFATALLLPGLGSVLATPFRAAGMSDLWFGIEQRGRQSLNKQWEAGEIQALSDDDFNRLHAELEEFYTVARKADVSDEQPAERSKFMNFLRLNANNYGLFKAEQRRRMLQNLERSGNTTAARIAALNGMLDARSETRSKAVESLADQKRRARLAGTIGAMLPFGIAGAAYTFEGVGSAASSAYNYLSTVQLPTAAELGSGARGLVESTSGFFGAVTDKLYNVWLASPSTDQAVMAAGEYLGGIKNDFLAGYAGADAAIGVGSEAGKQAANALVDPGTAAGRLAVSGFTDTASGVPEVMNTIGNAPTKDAIGSAQDIDARLVAGVTAKAEGLAVSDGVLPGPVEPNDFMKEVPANLRLGDPEHGLPGLTYDPRFDPDLINTAVKPVNADGALSRPDVPVGIAPELMGEFPSKVTLTVPSGPIDGDETPALWKIFKEKLGLGPAARQAVIKDIIAANPDHAVNLKKGLIFDGQKLDVPKSALLRIAEATKLSPAEIIRRIGSLR